MFDVVAYNADYFSALKATPRKSALMIGVVAYTVEKR
jgi:hypothetical protein